MASACDVGPRGLGKVGVQRGVELDSPGVPELRQKTAVNVFVIEPIR